MVTSQSGSYCPNLTLKEGLGPFQKITCIILLIWLEFVIKLDNVGYIWTKSCLHDVGAYYGVIKFIHSINDITCYYYMC
jgi:hypothetical protein